MHVEQLRQADDLEGMTNQAVDPDTPTRDGGDQRSPRVGEGIGQAPPQRGGDHRQQSSRVGVDPHLGRRIGSFGHEDAIAIDPQRSDRLLAAVARPRCLNAGCTRMESAIQNMPILVAT